MPHRRHPFCQGHDRRHRAAPLAEADAAFKRARRQTGREQGGDLIRQAPHRARVQSRCGAHPPLAPHARCSRAKGGHPCVWRAWRPPSGASRWPRTVSTCSPRAMTRAWPSSLQVSSRRWPPVRRPPRRAAPRGGRAPRSRGHLRTHGPPSGGWRAGAGPRRASRDTGLRWPQVTQLRGVGRHRDTVSRSSWPGLLHCDDVPGLPRTNNARASRFHDTRRRLLRTTGHQGLPPRTLQRQGAWELLRTPTEAQGLDAVGHTPLEALGQERQRCAAHRQRGRLPSRSLKQTQAQCDPLRQQWST